VNDTPTPCCVRDAGRPDDSRSSGRHTTFCPNEPTRSPQAILPEESKPTGMWMHPCRPPFPEGRHPSCRYQSITLSNFEAYASYPYSGLLVTVNRYPENPQLTRTVPDHRALRVHAHLAVRFARHRITRRLETLNQFVQTLCDQRRVANPFVPSRPHPRRLPASSPIIRYPYYRPCAFLLRPPDMANRDRHEWMDRLATQQKNRPVSRLITFYCRPYEMSRPSSYLII